MDYNINEIVNMVVSGIKETAERSNAFGNFIKPEVGSVIIGRFVPNLHNPAQSVYKYYHHGWNTASGTYQSFLCPSTYGENCPICQKSKMWYRSGSDFHKKLSKEIRRKENSLINFYVISDNKNTKNAGQVKILRCGAILEKIITDATVGGDSEQFGPRVWSFKPDGCNFKIVVELNGVGKDAWPTYVQSKFLFPSAIEGMTDEKNMEIFKGSFDLEKVNDRVPLDRLQQALNTFISENLGASEASAPAAPTPPSRPISPPMEDEEIPGLESPATPPPPSAPATGQAVNEEDLDELLKDIG